MRKPQRGARFLAALAFTITAAVMAPTAVAAAESPAPSPTAAAASPVGTIVFVKNHNIWMAKGDGSGQRQVTKDGRAEDPYWSPTMSDAGVIAAGNGPFIVRMKQDGSVLNTMDPPALKNSAGRWTDGKPIDVAVSPDGKLIAYTFADISCPIGVPSCGGARYVTAYTAADHLTNAANYGTTFFHNPYWVTNSRTIQNGGYGSQMNLHDVGSNKHVYWFDDRDYAHPSEDLSDPSVTRDGKLLAAVRSYGSTTHFIWYRVSGNIATGLPAVPEYLCVTDEDESYAGPVWAPDGSALATEESDGIWIKPDPTNCPSQARLAIPGGSEPHWSTAAMQALPQNFTVTKAPSVTGVPQAGGTLTASAGTWAPTATKVAYQWKKNGKAISGATSRTYLLKSADRGSLVTVTVTGQRTGYVTKSISSASVRINKDFSAPAPKISGTPKSGAKLTATAGTWSPKPASVSYQWKRDGKSISGAKSRTYTVKASDKGRLISVSVTGKKSGYTTKTVNSKAVRIAK